MNFVLGVICIIFGLLNSLKPKKMVRLRHILDVNYKEPTDYAIKMSIIGGIILIIIGIVLMFVKVF